MIGCNITTMIIVICALSCIGQYQGVPDPPVAGLVLLPNISTPDTGPVYSVPTPSLEILGPAVYSIVEGEELALICKLTGSLKRSSSLLWKRKGRMMPNGSPYISGGQVIIKRVSRQDGGEYQCVNNITDGSTAKKLINVLYPPTVSVQKLYHSHRSTITMEIVCRVQGNPITSPTWVFTSLQGRVSNNSKEVDSVVKRGDDKDIISVVIINNPLDLHLGQYSCRAKNRLGEDSQKILVQGFFEQRQTFSVANCRILLPVETLALLACLVFCFHF